MNPFEMVVVIVIVVMVAGIIRARMGIGHGRHGPAAAGDGEENRRLREEVRTLKDRVEVLERIVTDRTHALDMEIERLRDR